MAFERSGRVRFKDSILERTAKAVKEVQALCCNLEGEQLEVQNEDRALQRLAEHLDHIFLHGLRHVTPGYWAFIQNYTHKDIINEIKALNRLSTDLGRSRAWLYKALNESSLESYINCFLEDPSNVKKYYIDLALLRDKERLSLLQTLISGLDFVSFKLELNIAFFDLVSHVPRSATERQSSLDNISLHSCDSSTQASPSVPETPEDSNSLERPELCRTFSSKSCRESSIQDDMILEKVTKLQRSLVKSKLLEDEGRDCVDSGGSVIRTDMKEKDEGRDCVDSGGIDVRTEMEEKEIGDVPEERLPQFNKERVILPERPTTLPVISFEERLHVTLHNYVDLKGSANGTLFPGAVHLKDKKKKSKKRRKSSKKSISSTSESASPSSQSINSLPVNGENGVQLLNATVKAMERQDTIGGGIDQLGESILPNDVQDDLNNASSCSSVGGSASENGHTDMVAGFSNSSSIRGSDMVAGFNNSSSVRGSDMVAGFSNSRSDEYSNGLEQNNVYAKDRNGNDDRNVQTVRHNSIEVDSAIDIANGASVEISPNVTEEKMGIGCHGDKQCGQSMSATSVDELTYRDGGVYVGDKSNAIPTSDSETIHESVTGGTVEDSECSIASTGLGEHYPIPVKHNQSLDGQSYESLFSSTSEVFAGVQELKSPGDGASETESEDSVKLRSNSQIETFPWIVRIDSNTKLHLMLEVFLHSDEKYLELFQVCSCHNQGEVKPGLLLLSSWAIYILRNSGKKKRYKAEKRISLEDLDTISVAMNFQILFVIYRDGKNVKTLSICTREEELSKMIISHLNVSCKESATFPPSVVTDASLHKQTLQTWAAMECRQPVKALRLYRYNLIHWDDCTDLSSEPDLSIYKQVIYKVGRLSYRTKDSRFLGSFWQPGYFELRNCILSRYSEKGSKKSQWSLQLSPPDFTGCRRIRQRDRSHCFEILQSKGRSYMMSCENERQLSSWLSSICRVMAEQQSLASSPPSGAPVQPCCSLVTSHKLLLFHEDSQTSFLRCLASCDVTSLTCLKIAKRESQYVVLEFLPAESETPWILYFFSCKEVEKFHISLCEAFHESTQRVLPVEHLLDFRTQQRTATCLSAIKTSNNNRSALCQ